MLLRMILCFAPCHSSQKTKGYSAALTHVGPVCCTSLAEQQQEIGASQKCSLLKSLGQQRRLMERWAAHHLIIDGLCDRVP